MPLNLLNQCGLQWGIEDPLTDFIAGSGQRHHMINIQIVQAARNLCAQTLLSQKIPIRARGRCKSARHPNARLRQLTDHFSQRSIFAADRGDIPHPQLFKRQHIGIMIENIHSTPCLFILYSSALILNTHALMSLTVFILSDGTGITAETFAHSILSQFNLKFRLLRLPFIDSRIKAALAADRINQTALESERRPIVFTTLVDPVLNEMVKGARALVMDIFQTFVEPLEQELGIEASHAIGRGHWTADSEAYCQRIEAINFSLAHDDGQSDHNLEQAEVILIGVSRSGKTPTSLYLAMQYGVRTANYPLIPEDFERGALPGPLAAYKSKLFGLSIDAYRLSQIRAARRPGSRYAALENCRAEISAAQTLMERENIPYLCSTHKSIEEIATTVLQECKLEKVIY